METNNNTNNNNTNNETEAAQSSHEVTAKQLKRCLLYTSPSPRDLH